VIGKFIAAIIEFIVGVGGALPQMAKNQSRRLDIKEGVKRARAKGRQLRIERRNLRKNKRLEKAKRKHEIRGDN